MFDQLNISDFPLSLKGNKARVERFLADFGLRLESVDYYAVVIDDEGHIVAGGGLAGDVIKCIAVAPQARETGLSSRLITHLVRMASERGTQSVKVYTKPENRKVFESMGFKVIAKSPCAILMENGVRGINAYSDYLRKMRGEREGGAGAIVMNANPFTLGHLHLIRQAAKASPWLYVIVVREDHEMFNYAERKAMIAAAIEAHRDELPNVTLVEGSDYAVSEVSFPTYFLKQVTDATDTHITLDLDLFASYIAPALGVTKRFVGSEPNDRLTARYNELMAKQLPERGISTQVVERLKRSGVPICATDVRETLSCESLYPALALVPPTTVPYLIARLAVMSLQTELDTTPKPGLVDKHDNGAHTDMDYALMCKSIEALRPYLVKLAAMGVEWGLQRQDIDVAQIRQIGIDAERAMLRATGGVNTHRGALFALGLTATVAAWQVMQRKQLRPWALSRNIASTAKRFTRPQGTHGSQAKTTHQAYGALDMACGGYHDLFDDWLLLLREVSSGEFSRDNEACIWLLLHIMSDLDDTNVIYRTGGRERLREVQDMAAQLEGHCSAISGLDFDRLSQLNDRFVALNISPGGSADMVALTLFVKALLD